MRAALSELAEIVGGDLIGDGDFVLTGLASLEKAGPSDLSFIADARYASQLEASAAGAVLIGLDREADRPSVQVADPYLAFLVLLERFHPVRHPEWGIDSRAVVSQTASLGEDVNIGPHATIEAGARIGDRAVIYPGTYVGENCEVGDDCVLFSNVSLYAGTRLGTGVLIHSGAVLGADGFGFHPQPDGSFRKIPQIGRVVVEDDVEIGANACVDRAMMGETVIGTGTKLDNLVQIAHNCSVGAHSVFAGQAALSGSVKTGPHVQVGGQVGVADHVTIGEGAAIMAQSGIAADVDAGATMFGSPAVGSRQFMRGHFYTLRLRELFGGFRRLERRVERLEGEENR